MTRTKRDGEQVARFRRMWEDELAGAALYRALAERGDDPRRDIFLSLAEAEERHAAHWASAAAERGVELRSPRMPFRVRVLRFLAARLGTDTVLPLVIRAEAAGADKYRGVAEAPAGMAAQEATHGRVVAALSGGDTTGGRIAASEGRHRVAIGGLLRAGVFGVQDGLLSNFALVMGVAGGTSSGSFVVLAGVAGLVAGAFSMAAGEWVSVASQRELYQHELHIEREELAAFPEEEAEELALIYQAKGIERREAEAIVDRIMRRPDIALDTLAREELGIDPQGLASPWVASSSSFLAFAVGAIIPLLPFLFASGGIPIGISAAASVIVLFGVGAFVSVFTGRSALRNGARLVVIGVLVAAVTFGVGKAVGTNVG